MASLHNPYRHDGDGDGLNVVFVHGLGGHPTQTWMSDKDDDTTLWPVWLGEEARCSCWALGYDARLSAWVEDAMPLPDQGLSVLEALAIEPDLRDRPLILVGHSLGGLVIKTAIMEAMNAGAERYRAIASSVVGVVFVSTPHSGAELARVANAVRFMLRTNEQVRSAGAHDAQLRALKRQFDSAHARLNFRVRTFSERHGVFVGRRVFRLPIGFKVKVVNADSGESHVPGDYAIPLPEDHFSICKPRTRQSHIHKSVVAFLREVREARRPASLPDQVERIDRKFETQSVKIDQILAAVSAKKGIPVPALRPILALLGESRAPEAEVVRRFHEKAEELVAARESLARHAAQIGAATDTGKLHVLALAKIDAGECADARDILLTSREQLRMRSERSLRDEARLLEDVARVEKLQLRYRAAAGYFAEAARLLDFDPDAASELVGLQFSALQAQGSELGDNDALGEAVVLAEGLLARYPRPEYPLDWATTQNNLGTALLMSGERESGTRLLEDAVAAWRAALIVFESSGATHHATVARHNLDSVAALLIERRS